MSTFWDVFRDCSPSAASGTARLWAAGHTCGCTAASVWPSVREAEVISRGKKTAVKQLTAVSPPATRKDNRLSNSQNRNQTLKSRDLEHNFTTNNTSECRERDRDWPWSKQSSRFSMTPDYGTGISKNVAIFFAGHQLCEANAPCDRFMRPNCTLALHHRVIDYRASASTRTTSTLKRSCIP